MDFTALPPRRLTDDAERADLELLKHEPLLNHPIFTKAQRLTGYTKVGESGLLMLKASDRRTGDQVAIKVHVGRVHMGGVHGC